jgi:symplekin
MSVDQQIKQLDDARKLVLSDANYYPQIIQGILPIVGPGARVELRRWVSDFFVETFSSPSIPAQQKETMSLVVLETLKTLIETPNEDTAVVKSVVQTAASIYPLVFRWMYVLPSPPVDICKPMRLLPMQAPLKFGILLIDGGHGNSSKCTDLTCVREQY